MTTTYDTRNVCIAKLTTIYIKHKPINSASTPWTGTPLIYVQPCAL